MEPRTTPNSLTHYSMRPSPLPAQRLLSSSNHLPINSISQVLPYLNGRHDYSSNQSTDPQDILAFRANQTRVLKCKNYVHANEKQTCSKKVKQSRRTSAAGTQHTERGNTMETKRYEKTGWIAGNDSFFN